MIGLFFYVKYKDGGKTMSTSLVDSYELAKKDFDKIKEFEWKELIVMAGDMKESVEKIIIKEKK